MNRKSKGNITFKALVKIRLVTVLKT